MLLAALVEAARRVSATRSRRDKIAILAEVLRTLEESEIAAAVGFLSGSVRQGRIGIGWATLTPHTREPASEPSLAILDLDAAIDAIRVTTGAGSVAARTNLLQNLFARATAEEADFIKRLLLGDLRQGALEGIAAEAIGAAAGVPATAVRRGLMLSGDLGATATTALTGGEDALGAIGLELLRPIRPMLASSADTIEEALHMTGEASIEWKLDGIRIQVHRHGADVRVFTRRLNDVTNRVPEIVHAALDIDARAFVLDGEAMGLGPDERPKVFAEIMSRMGTAAVPDSEDEVLSDAMVPFFFDLLHLDGRDLIDEPLSDRRVALETLAGRWVIPGVVTADPAEGDRLLDAALGAGHEGAVVKALGSTYQAGRRGKSWVKVKRAKTLDLVVLGAEWGHGRRQGYLSNLHLGARDGESFVMVGKTFKGLTDELLRWQTERFLELETSRKGITVFVRPEIVVEIELDGAQASPRYPGGVALRFARVVRYRPDKSPADTDTIEAVRALL